MDITIDQQVIAQAVSDVVGKGIAQGVGSWETKKAIEEAVQLAVIEAGLPQMLHDQVRSAIDAQSGPIIAALVEEVMPAMREAFKSSLHAALVAMVYGLAQGRPSYMGEEDRRRWNEISERLLHREGDDGTVTGRKSASHEGR